MHIRVGCFARCRVFAAAAAAVLAAGTANAQIGPDVIVGDLYDLEYWGAAQGFDAYSVGTYSCNIGDQVLQWHGNTNQHPVIAQHMYRLKGGRFEMIGQSWLKHGFLALTNDLCDTCQDPGSGSLLGVGCADPYSAGLNGSQNRLGPKFQVNPFNGDFTYPHLTPSGHGTIAGRIQVPEADMDPPQNPGALYFVEGHYVTPDDASWNNQMNNVSYRPITVTGSHNINLSAATVRESPAIEAWAAYESGVGVTFATVPNDGRVYLAWKPTDLGGGQWRYEFAIYNMNADRAIGSFAIPIPIGASATDPYFHDVHYHSGEPYDGADWPMAVGTTFVSWSTAAFGADPDANAIRWGTLYNFGFTSDASPEELGDAEIRLFKPGSPDFIDIPLPDPGIIVEDNDMCANAQPVTDGAHVIDNTGATTDGPDEPDDCENAGDTDIQSDIWFLYQATCTGAVTVDLCGSAYDTKVGVYAGSCPTTSGEVIVCNDDFDCDGDGTVQDDGYVSRVSFAVVQGQDYLIRVGGFGGAQGSGVMQIDCDGPGIIDCNNNGIDDAEDIAGGFSDDCNENGIPDECETTGGKVISYESSVNPPLAIPDGTGSFVTHSFNINETGSIVDLNVDLQISHTYNGDLIVKLEHNGTEVILIDRPGYSGSGFGYNNNGFDITLDDEGTGGPIENVDSGGPTVTSPPSYEPQQALSAFDRMDRQGTWTVSISDNASQDTGTLDYVALGIEGEGAKIPPCITDCNGNGVDDATDILKGTSGDCNKNGIPDECDIAAGEPDCAGGPLGVPAIGALIYDDEDSNCADCHAPDGSGGFGPDIRNKSRVQIWNMLQPPSDHPGGTFPEFTQFDYADLEAFLSTNGSRGRPDLIPDSCQEDLPDCDGDGVTDACELETGLQVDLDYNGIPDNCESVDCPSDIAEDDFAVNAADLAMLLGAWGPNPGHPADLSGNGIVNAEDLAILLGDWGPCE